MSQGVYIIVKTRENKIHLYHRQKLMALLSFKGALVGEDYLTLSFLQQRYGVAQCQWIFS